MPFSEHDNVDHPVSLYAATQEGQRADGAHLQPPLRPADHRPALLHRLRPVGPARHGAVPVHQGHPRGPSRSTSSTTARCSATSPTSTTSSRASCACSTAPPQREPRSSTPTTPTRRTSDAPYRIFNIGNHSPVQLMDFIDALEEALGQKAKKQLPADAAGRRAGGSRSR